MLAKGCQKNIWHKITTQQKIFYVEVGMFSV